MVVPLPVSRHPRSHAVATVFLSAVEALERLPDVLQRYGLDGAEKPSQPRLLLYGRGVRGPRREDLAFVAGCEVRVIKNIPGMTEADPWANATLKCGPESNRGAQALAVNECFRRCEAHRPISV